jgi:hypothetical protein
MRKIKKRALLILRKVVFCNFEAYIQGLYEDLESRSIANITVLKGSLFFTKTY